MDNFNTHGGYFAPQGYTKVNEGGSHEENPNGGVQLGVDQNGVPNLLEEGEPVYKDFVYSDNIKADAKFLEQFGIPKKYADKLYSQIADAYIDEAEVRPYDEISANGLNAMLGRLAEAQEAQKAAEEEAALMEELKNMSPEEIAAIQEALAQEAAAQQMPQEQVQSEVAPDMVAPEQVMPEAVAPEIPMMACGGKMNKYDGGGRKGHPVRKALDTFFNGPEGLNKMEVWVAPGKGDPAAIEKATSDIAKYSDQVAKLRKELGFFAPYGSIPMRNLRAAKSELWALKGGPAKILTGALGVAGIGAGAGIIGNTDWSANSSNDKPAKETRRERQQEGLVVFDEFAKGGPMNLYPWGTKNLQRSPSWYPQSRNRWEFNPDWSTGRYLAADYDAPYGYIPAPITGISNGENFVLNFNDNPVGPTLLDNAYVTPTQNGVMLPDITITAPPTMLNEARIEAEGATLLNEARLMPPTARKSGYPGSQKAIVNMPAIPNLAIDIDDDPELADIINGPVDPFQLDDTNIDVPELSKGLLRKAKWDKIKGKLGGFDTRLLSPFVDAAMGLANLATPADHYDFTPIRPYLPSGRIRQQYERYNPIDQNMVTNQMLAQANANMRALRNAGLGPSAGANLLAADYNAGLNLGNALANVWDANNQRRNQVIAQNNQADAAIANYDWQVELARANALNQFAPYNQRMALQIQMLNNQAEQDKYNAVAASINSGKKFLNDYGWELMNRNMVNSNRGLLGYGIGRMNDVVYDKNGNPILLAKCGGKINKKK